MKLSSTSVREYNQCQRKFLYKRIQKLSPDHGYIPSPALRFGGFFAKLSEKRKRYTPHEILKNGHDSGLSENDLAKMFCMMNTYIDNIPNNEKVIMTEKWINSNKYIGKIDKLVSIDGTNYIVEEKTSSDINKSSLETTLIFDEQISIYSSVLDDFKADGIIYRVTSKPSERRKKLESFEEYAKRCVCEFAEIRLDVRNNESIKETLKKIDSISEEIDMKTKDEEFFRNEKNCEVWGSPCEFFARCYGIPYLVAKGKW